MDKNNIFELISSLLAFYKSQNAKNSSPSDVVDKNNIFTTISSFLSKKEQPTATGVSPNEEKPPREKTRNESSAPLQKGMLATLTSHDDFVKRVMKNNK